MRKQYFMECIQNDADRRWWTLDKKYLITPEEVDGEKIWKVLDNDGTARRGATPNDIIACLSDGELIHFKLVTQDIFEKGDRVRIINNSLQGRNDKYELFEKGDIATVTFVTHPLGKRVRLGYNEYNLMDSADIELYDGTEALEAPQAAPINVKMEIPTENDLRASIHEKLEDIVQTVYGNQEVLNLSYDKFMKLLKVKSFFE